MRDNLRAVRLRVGRNIRSLRALRGLSQERLAELVGNTEKHIGQVERGEVNVTIDILTAIAAGLSVNVWELLGPAPESTPGSRICAITQRDLDQIEQALRIVNRAKRTSRRRERGSD
jgi:transcriptional regulator with XRE-family HTH domain